MCIRKTFKFHDFPYLVNKNSHVHRKTHQFKQATPGMFVWQINRVQMTCDIMRFRSVCHMILEYSHVTSSLSRTVSSVQPEGRDLWSALPLKRFDLLRGSAPSRSSSSSCNSRLSPASIGSSVTSARRSNQVSVYDNLMVFYSFLKSERSAKCLKSIHFLAFYLAWVLPFSAAPCAPDASNPGSSDSPLCGTPWDKDSPYLHTRSEHY